MIRTLLLGTALAAGLIAGGAQASGSAQPQRSLPSFAELDANGDGRVTLVELQRMPALRGGERFALIDVNRDGRITREELVKATASLPEGRANRSVEQRADRMMARLDANGDGVIVPDEMARAAARNRDEAPGVRLMQKADVNKDGAITVDEYAALNARLGQRLGGQGQKGQGQQGQGGGWQN